MNIRLYLACASLLAVTLPALAAPERSPSAAGVDRGGDAKVILAQRGGEGPPGQAGRGKGGGGDGGGPGMRKGGGGGSPGGGGGPAVAPRGGGGPAMAPGGGGGQGTVIQRRGGGGPVVRAPDVRGGADVRVRSRVYVGEPQRYDRWRYRYRDRGPRVGIYIAGGRGWCHRHHWRWRVLRHCHRYSYRGHRHGRWR